jgi:allantoinase
MPATSTSTLAIAGTIVTAGRPPFRGVVETRNGKIACVAEGTPGTLADPLLDFGDNLVFPGFVDVHVHSSSLGAEGLAKATAAAAAGGVTTLVDMPYDVPAPIDTPELFERKARALKDEVHIDVGLLGTLSPKGGSAIASEMVSAGACGIMLSLWEQDSRRYPRVEYGELRKIFQSVAQVNGLVSMHPETDAIIRPLLDEALCCANQRNWRLHAHTRPPVSEAHGVMTALEFAREAGTRLHLHQLSHARSFDLIQSYRQQGVRVTGETIVHHLLFEEDDVRTKGGRVKINPPLRSAENRDDLWRRLDDGILSIVASDHSPWPLAEKTRPEILRNQSGMPGLETYPSVFLGEGLRRGISCTRLAQVSAKTPADVFGLDQKGDIQVGLDADLIVFDPSATWQVRPETLKTSAGWDPYDDRLLHGRVIATILRGQMIWDGANLLSRPGFGRWVGPRAN